MADFLENELVDTSISKLYLENDLTDVKFSFKSNGSTVLLPAHKLILASGSPVFRTMFFGSLPEKDTVEIVDATAEEFKEFLQFFYLRKIKLTMDNMEGVTRLADKYDVLNCLNTCATFLESQLNDSNMLWGYQLAMSLNNQKLKQFCESKITILSADMFKTEAFLKCDRNVLKSILMMDVLACDEIDLFEACVEWAKTACRKNRLNENDSKNLKEQLGDCIYLIQFNKITNDELTRIVANELYADMFNREELLEITRASLVPNFEPKIFKKLTRINLLFSANKNSELLLQRTPNSVGYYNGKYLYSKETTRFTSNSLLLLGKVNFTIDEDILREPNVDFNVINCSFNKTLYTGKLNRMVDLNKGILIKPQEMYMIQVNIPQNIIGTYGTRSSWNELEEVKMGTNIIINFLKNPNDRIDRYDGGLVSSMSFKRVLW